MKKTTRILIVDDHPAILQVFSEMLRTQGYEVWEASTGQQGLQATREKHPDVVLLDVVLPDLSGIEVCRQIKADAALSGIFVVLVSGEATGVAHKVDGLDTGADDYLVKPVAPDEFLARIRTIVRLRDTTAALRASEQHYRKLIEILPDAVCVIDLQGRVIAVNQRSVQMTGYANREELLERSAFDLIPLEDRERLSGDIARTLETGAIRNVAYALLNKGGDRLAVELNASALTDANDRPSGIVVVGRDITERKRAEEAVRESEESMWALLNAVQESLLLVDARGTVLIANETVARRLGRPAEALVGCCLYDLLPPDLAASRKQRFEEAIRTGSFVHFEDVRGDRHVENGLYPVIDAEGMVKKVGVFGLDVTQRKLAEQQLRWSEARFREMADNIRQGLWLTEPQSSRILYLNPGFCSIWGVSAEDLYADPNAWIKAIHPDDLQHVRNSFQEQVKGKSTRVVFRITRPDGATRWIENRGFPIINDEGTIVRVSGIAEDITQRKLAEEKLSQLSCAVEQNPASIVITDPAGNIEYANPKFVELSGYALAEVVGRNPRILKSGETSREAYQELWQTITAGKEWHGEFHNKKKNGDLYWESASISPIRDLTGRITHFVAVKEDITGRKRAGEALQEAEARYRGIFENATEGIFRSTPEGHLVVANPALARIFGYKSPEEMVSSVTDIGRQICASPERRRELQRILDKEGSVQGFEAENYRKDGSRIWIRLNGRAVRDANGAVLNYQGTIQDDTERKWSENLLQVKRDFGVFLSSTNDLTAALNRLLAIALQSSGVDCGVVHLVDPKTEALDLAAQHGLSARFAKGASHFSAAVDQGRMEDAGPRISRPQGKPLADIVRQLKREGLRAMEVIPIQHSGRVVAVLSLGSRRRREIPAKGRQAIESVVTEAGGAIARIRAEQSLHANRQLLEKTLNNLHDAVFLLDARTGIVQECNPAATHIFGYTRDEMVGRTPDFLHPTEALLQQLNQHLPSGSQEKGFKGEFELQMKRKDGKLFPTEHSLTAIRDETGRLVSWVNVVREITARKRAEEELRRLPQRIIEAQEAERQRVARELHDSVNQLIASARMRLRKVEAGVAALSPASREMLARCQDLLVQALEENRRIAHNLRPSDLDELGLDTACRNFCNEIQSRTNLAVKPSIMRLSRRLPPAVELNLFRVVQEALNNVEKHARAKTVRLRLAFQNGSIVLRIQDDGRGFDPRAVKTGKGKTGGIGLTNMRERAASLGGTCQVESVLKRGTVITVRVPCLSAR